MYITGHSACGQIAPYPQKALCGQIAPYPQKAPCGEQRQATPVILCSLLVCLYSTNAFKNNTSCLPMCRAKERKKNKETLGVSEKQAGERFLSVETQSWVLDSDIGQML